MLAGVASCEGKGILGDFPDIQFAFGGGAAIRLKGEVQDIDYIISSGDYIGLGQGLPQVQYSRTRTGIAIEGENLYIAVSQKEVKATEMDEFFNQHFGTTDFVAYDASTVSQLYINSKFNSNIKGIDHPRAVRNYIMIRALENE